MDVDSDYLSGFAHRPPNDTAAVAGTADPSGPKVANGIGFPPRPGTRCFAADPSDLVVSTASATGSCADAFTLESDHFSYLHPNEERARPAIDRVLAAAEEDRRAAFLAETDMSRGLTREIPAPRPMMVKPKTAEQRSS